MPTPSHSYSSQALEAEVRGDLGLQVGQRWGLENGGVDPWLLGTEGGCRLYSHLWLAVKDVPGVLCPGGGAEGHKCLLSPCSMGNVAGGHRVHAGFTSALASDRSECTWP